MIFFWNLFSLFFSIFFNFFSGMHTTHIWYGIHAYQLYLSLARRCQEIKSSSIPTLSPEQKYKQNIKIMKAIISGLLPFSTVENEEFRDCFSLVILIKFHF